MVSVRKNSKKRVFDIISKNQGISRKSISQILSITPAAVSIIVAELIAGGIVLEDGEEMSVVEGRRQVRLVINPDAFYTVGLELSANRINCILCNATVTIIDRIYETIECDSPPEAVVEQMVGSVEEVLTRCGIKKEQVKAIGFSCPGPCDSEQGIVINPPNFTKWRTVPIRRMLEQRVGIPIVFDHHLRMATLCESWLGEAKTSTHLLLCGILETGIAACFSINGRILYGFHNSSGELGHMQIDPNGPLCSCGNYGCLESMADGRAILRNTKTHFAAEGISFAALNGKQIPVEELTLDDILENETANDIIREEMLLAARHVSTALMNAVMLFGPDTIVLFGKIPIQSSLLEDAVKRSIQGSCYPPFNKEIIVRTTSFGDDICALGGVCMVMERMVL